MTRKELYTPVRYPAWQREYEAAILELDPAKASGLISSAQAAIQERIGSLIYEACPGERNAIANALMFLGLLMHSGNTDNASHLDRAA